MSNKEKITYMDGFKDAIDVVKEDVIGALEDNPEACRKLGKRLVSFNLLAEAEKRWEERKCGSE